MILCRNISFTFLQTNDIILEIPIYVAAVDYFVKYVSQVLYLEGTIAS